MAVHKEKVELLRKIDIFPASENMSSILSPNTAKSYVSRKEILSSTRDQQLKICMLYKKGA